MAISNRAMSHPVCYIYYIYIPLYPLLCPTLAWITVGFPGLSWTLKSPEALLGKGFLDFSGRYRITERVGFGRASGPDGLTHGELLIHSR